MKEHTYIDDEGNERSSWDDLSWKAFRKRLEKEFEDATSKKIWKVRQKPTEEGITFAYGMIAEHKDSGLDLEEDAFIQMIIQKSDENRD